MRYSIFEYHVGDIDIGEQGFGHYVFSTDIFSLVKSLISEGRDIELVDYLELKRRMSKEETFYLGIENSFNERFYVTFKLPYVVNKEGDRVVSHRYSVVGVILRGTLVNIASIPNRVVTARGPLTAAKAVVPTNSKNIRVVSQSEIQRNAKSVKNSFIVLEEVYGKRYYIAFDC